MGEGTIERTDSGVSRRTMIKRVGVGTALVWAAPALSTAASSAGASPVCHGASCLQSCFNYPSTCGESSCYCDTDTEGACHCLNFSHFCEAYPQGCASSADCAPGHYCVADTCCAGTICAPDCGVEPVNAGATSPSGRRPAG